MNNKRQYYEGIEILRAMACFMVVACHIFLPEMRGFSEAWAPAIFYQSWFRGAVPIFFMITGHLLLEGDEDIIAFYRKRMMRIIYPLLFYAVFYNVTSTVMTGGDVSFINIVELIFLHHFEHLWFMYILVGVYIFMPFLRKIFLYTNRKEKIIFTSIWLLLFIIIPAIFPYDNLADTVQTVYGLQQFAGQIGYVFVGGCLKHTHYDNKYILLLGYVISVVSMFAFIFASSANSETPNIMFANNRSPFAFSQAIFLFLLIKDMPLIKFKNTLNEIAKYSFGIYFVHIIFIKILFKVHAYDLPITPWILLPALAITAFILSFFTIKYGKKIKYLQKVIG